MIEPVLLTLAALVLATTLAGLLRVVRGPTTADRLSAALLLGTGGVAVLLLLARAWELPALRDVALVFALLASVTGVAFVRHYARDLRSEQHDDP